MQGPAGVPNSPLQTNRIGKPSDCNGGWGGGGGWGGASAGFCVWERGSQIVTGVGVRIGGKSLFLVWGRGSQNVTGVNWAWVKDGNGGVG